MSHWTGQFLSSTPLATELAGICLGSVTRLLAAAVLTCTWLAQGASAQEKEGRSASIATPPRNPGFLRAFKVLGVHTGEDTVRVRFEWEQVPGVAEYHLRGQWADPESWALRSEQFKVTARSAVEWNDRRVIVELLLNSGRHSWSVVALRGDADVGDYAHPARHSFEIR